MVFVLLISGFLAVLGVGYPLFAIISYQIYRLLGGNQSFLDYMSEV